MKIQSAFFPWSLDRKRLGALPVLALIAFGGSLQPAFAEDETTVCNLDGQLVNYGNVLAGCEVSPIADVDIFDFAGQAGENFRAIVTRTGGGSFSSVCAEVRDPLGAVFIPNACGGTLSFEDSLPLSGLYRIIVSEAGNDDVVLFNLSLERLAPPRSSTPVSYGQVLEGRMIAPITDLDVFSFGGSSGSTIRILVTRTGGGSFSSVCAELRDPNNVEVIPLTCGGALEFEPALTASGPHQLIVTEAGNDDVVNYNLSLQCILGSCGSTPPACLVDLSLDGSTLNLDVLLGSPTAARWDLYVDTLYGPFLVVRQVIPVVDPPTSFQIPIPDFPTLGQVVFWNSLNTADGLTCFGFDQIDTGPIGPEASPADIESIRQSIQTPQ